MSQRINPADTTTSTTIPAFAQSVPTLHDEGSKQGPLLADTAPVITATTTTTAVPVTAPVESEESNAFIAKGARHLLHEYLGHDTGTGVSTSRLFDLLSEAGGSSEDRGHLYKIALGVTSVADRSSEMDVLGQQEEEYSRLVASKKRSQQYGHGGSWKQLRSQGAMGSLYDRWRDQGSGNGGSSVQLRPPQMEHISNVLGALEVAYPTCSLDAATTMATLLAPLSLLFAAELDLYYCVTGFMFLLCRDGLISISSIFPTGSDPMALPARDRIAACFGVEPPSSTAMAVRASEVVVVASTSSSPASDTLAGCGGGGLVADAPSVSSMGGGRVRNADVGEEGARLRKLCGSFVAQLHWFNPTLYSHMHGLHQQGGICFEDWVPHILRTLLVQQVCRFDQLLRLWDAYLKEGSLGLHQYVVLTLLEERTWELTEGPWGDVGAHEAVLLGKKFGWGADDAYPALLPPSTLRVDVPLVLQRAERLRERARHAGLSWE